MRNHSVIIVEVRLGLIGCQAKMKEVPKGRYEFGENYLAFSRILDGGLIKVKEI